MKILITAGPTWVKIDEVRILTTIFSGKTGLYLAKQFAKNNHSVTLLINPHCLERKIQGMRVITFKYLEDFSKRITEELKKNKYDVIIHSAAVSDYKLNRVYKGKIPSGMRQLAFKLMPAEKIIKKIRKLAKDSLLIQFKLEIKRKGLLKKAYKSLKENKSDFVVANALEDLRLGYKAFLMDKNKNTISLGPKKDLFLSLRKIVTSLA